jgi:hypothetical protein
MCELSKVLYVCAQRWGCVDADPGGLLHCGPWHNLLYAIFRGCLEANLLFAVIGRDEWAAKSEISSAFCGDLSRKGVSDGQLLR